MFLRAASSGVAFVAVAVAVAGAEVGAVDIMVRMMQVYII
jgi:hypothetical protein